MLRTVIYLVYFCVRAKISLRMSRVPSNEMKVVAEALNPTAEPGGNAQGDDPPSFSAI